MSTPEPRQGERSVRIATALARRTAGTSRPQLCAACVDVLLVAGAGVTLMTGHTVGPVCSSSERTGLLEDLQFTLGEGPCQDAFAQGEPVLEPNLDLTRWPNFSGPALDAGVHGVFAFPLSAGQSRIGVMTLYNEATGALTDDQTADSLAMADVVAQTMLTMQSGAEPHTLAEGLDDAAGHRAEVHQASGMVAVQLGIEVAEALVRLRAYGYGTGRPVADVAADIVGRRLLLNNDHGEASPE